MILAIAGCAPGSTVTSYIYPVFLGIADTTAVREEYALAVPRNNGDHGYLIFVKEKVADQAPETPARAAGAPLEHGTNKMNRAGRIAPEVLGPPFLGLLSLYALRTPEVIAEIAYGHVNLGEHWAMVAGAYLFAVPPCIFYATVMKIAFSRFFSPNSWWAIVLSTFVGLCVGLSMAWVANSLISGRAGDPHVIRTMLPLALSLDFDGGAGEDAI